MHRCSSLVRAVVLSSSIVVVAASCGAQQPRAAESKFDFDAAWREVEHGFRSACGKAGVVGGSLMFVRGNEELGFVAHGLADRDAKRPVDRDTIYHWASCTKTFTAVAAMQFVERGKLQLDRPIVELVPELRAVHDPFGPIEGITVKHLLSHSAGFRAATWPWGGDKPWHPHEPTEWSQLVAMLPYTEVEFAPGSKFSYSNPGIVFVGRAIEALGGEPFETYVDKNLLRPLGMSRSYFDLTPYHLQGHRSHSYAVGENGAITDHGPDFDTGITVSNGGLNAPLPDMAKWLAFLLGASADGSDAAAVLSRAALESMWQPLLPTGRDGADSIGIGFFVHEQNGQRFIGHTGGQRDFVSVFYVHPASRTGALAAFNTSTAGPVMAEVRKLCIEKLSLPMAANVEAGAPGLDDGVMWGTRRIRKGANTVSGWQLLVTVSSGGHALERERVTRDGDDCILELKLTTPGADETTTQALEDLTVNVAAAETLGCRRVLVRIATWQRGVQYFVAPAHELAATFALR